MTFAARRRVLTRDVGGREPPEAARLWHRTGSILPNDTDKVVRARQRPNGGLVGSVTGRNCRHQARARFQQATSRSPLAS